MKKVCWILSGILVCTLLSPAFADIIGTAHLDGKAPERQPIDMSSVPACNNMHPDPVLEESVIVDDKNNLQNVAIFIRPESGQKIPAGDPAKKDPVVLDQKMCMYSPHVVAVQVGQPIKVRNLDDMAHNVHGITIDNAAPVFDQPGKDEKGKDIPPFTIAEEFKMKCDVHPWMVAWVVVVDNPYYAVTAADGSYKIDTKNLPDGNYSLVAWHEKYGESTQKITIKSGKTEKPVDFKFKAE